MSYSGLWRSVIINITTWPRPSSNPPTYVPSRDKTIIASRSSFSEFAFPFRIKNRGLLPQTLQKILWYFFNEIIHVVLLKMIWILAFLNLARGSPDLKSQLAGIFCFRLSSSFRSRSCCSSLEMRTMMRNSSIKSATS
jgi:hypothetical protein